jgi:tetratricopeptide (TPR) repeat protein
MDDQNFMRACELRNQGKFEEAINEFNALANETSDPIDKAGILLNAATTLRASGKLVLAKSQLNAVRLLVPSYENLLFDPNADKRAVFLILSAEIEEADICRGEGRNEEAVTRLNALLDRYARALKEPDFRSSYQIIQTNRAFLLADLGRWAEAQPILDEAESFEHPKAEIYFYLGYCCVGVKEYERAKQKLVQALSLGLPSHLEFRAHCALGMANYRLGDYARARIELEKGAEKADTSYIKQAKVWKWLEITYRSLGLTEDAERYAKLAEPSEVV